MADRGRGASSRALSMGKGKVAISERDRKWAQQCVECTVCEAARRKQRGFAFWLVRLLEGSVCPWCKAYERVYGRKAHEPAPEGRE